MIDKAEQQAQMRMSQQRAEEDNARFQKEQAEREVAEQAMKYRSDREASEASAKFQKKQETEREAEQENPNGTESEA